RRRTGRRRKTKNLRKELNEVRPSPRNDSKRAEFTSARVLSTSSSSNVRVPSTSSSSNTRLHSASSSTSSRVRRTSSSANARLHSTSSSTSVRVLSTSSSSNVQLHSTSSSTSARVLTTSSSTSSTRVRDTRRATPKSAAPLVPRTDLVTRGKLLARRRSTSTSPRSTPGSRGTSPEAAVLEDSHAQHPQTPHPQSQHPQAQHPQTQHPQAH
ncbi:unnamed protein product, partial [Closterium sp. NIES-54]